MDSMLLYLLFPSLFMIHEMEEILLIPSFMSSMVEHPKFKNFKELYSPFKFNLIVFEEFLILLAILAYSFYVGDFTIYQTIVHVFQSLYLKRYVPGLLSGIVTGVCCSIWIHQLLQNPFQLYFSSILTLLIILLNLALCFKLLNVFYKK